MSAAVKNHSTFPSGRPTRRFLSAGRRGCDKAVVPSVAERVDFRADFYNALVIQAIGVAGVALFCAGGGYV